MSQRIRTAIIGYGRSAQFLHAKGLQGNSDSFEVIAVSSHSQESRDRAKADFGCSVHSDYSQMLRECDIDLVIIVTRNDQHCEMACEAMAAGAHVLVTKPLGTSAEEVEKIYHFSSRYKKKVFPFFPARWGSDYRRIRQIVESGEIGSVFAIHRSVYGFATRNDWQTERKYGGGIILNWATHLIEPPMLLAGGKPKHLFGSCAQILNPGDTEDVFYAILSMENGIRIHSEWSFAPKGGPNWLVQGTKGCIIAHDTKLQITTGTPSQPADPTRFKDMEGNPTEERTEKVDEYLYGNPVEIYDAVAADLSNHSSFPVKQEDAIRLATILDGIKISQLENRLIPLS